MNEHEILKQAYFVLGLEPGASLPVVTTRYKKLILVWHPDRFKSAETKDYAQTELKKINGARDALTGHYRSGHKETGPCLCRSVPSDPVHEKPKEDAPKQKEQTQGPCKQSASDADKNGTASGATEQETKARPKDSGKSGQSGQSQKQVLGKGLRQKLAMGIAAVWFALSVVGLLFGHS